MVKRQRYILITCPEGGKRIRRYTDGTLSWHHGTLVSQWGCPAIRNVSNNKPIHTSPQTRDQVCSTNQPRQHHERQRSTTNPLDQTLQCSTQRDYNMRPRQRRSPDLHQPTVSTRPGRNPPRSRKRLPPTLAKHRAEIRRPNQTLAGHLQPATEPAPTTCQNNTTPTTQTPPSATSCTH